ncbi:DUF2169 family type VI secretion system accessory protein [Chondromyces crocatus]|uniref:DUF2169 domain-containing protein n=1 Tax=Chondromyces crocatus TaxID=52 RepID=A0A0K1EIY3_CHOCO|nr:DUF2169 domain-containing protein [Chondromyces crocatus]AKT40622.1 uncharacterized protein CMC5_047780 [Chondromyces crocatus]
MDVVSACPLRVGSTLWQPRADAWALTVVCKATYELTPGVSPLAQEQEAPNETDSYWDDDLRRSLRVASDMVPFKRRADILLTGSAYAPGRQPVPSLVTRLVLDEIDKAIAVFGDRAFTFDGELREPVRFVKMPLRWERAAGGSESRNPAGVPPDAPPDGRGLIPVPNLQSPGVHVTSRRDVIEPVGYGPIAPTWPERARKLHWYAARWNHAHWNAQPLPHDIDAGYFNAAPPDQQRDEIRPDERLMLENLHPEHARLITALQPVTPRVLVERGAGAVEERRLRCDTLWIDTDRCTCSLIWRAYIPLDHPQQPGRVVLSLVDERHGSLVGAMWRQETSARAPESPARPATWGANPLAGLPWSDGGAPPSTPAVREAMVVDTLNSPMTGIEASKPALPFVGNQSGWASSPPAAPAQSTPSPTDSRRAGHQTGPMLMPSRDVLPFSSNLPSTTSAPPIPGEPPALAAVMPPPAVPTSVVSPPVTPPPAVPLSPLSMPRPVALSAVVAPTVGQSLGAPASPSMPTAPEHVTPSVTQGFSTPITAPPMIGPLARFEADRSQERPREPAVIVESAAAPLHDVRDEVSLPSLEEFTLELCATLDASLALRPEDEPRLLKENQLTKPEWTRLREVWASEIKTELRRGRNGSLRRYDAAYVAQLERERGPITPEDVARMNVGTDRGDLDAVLRDIGLPTQSAIRIQRTWIGKMANDAALGASVRKAMAKAKAE